MLFWLSWLCHAVPMTSYSSASSLADSLGEQKVRWANIWQRLVAGGIGSPTNTFVSKENATCGLADGVRSRREVAVGMLDLDAGHCLNMNNIG